MTNDEFLKELQVTIDRRVAVEIATERERCAQIAETEEEAEGNPSPEVMLAMLAAGPVNNARAAIRAAKRNIARRIREQ